MLRTRSLILIVNDLFYTIRSYIMQSSFSLDRLLSIFLLFFLYIYSNLGLLLYQCASSEFLEIFLFVGLLDNDSRIISCFLLFIKKPRNDVF